MTTMDRGDMGDSICEVAARAVQTVRNKLEPAPKWTYQHAFGESAGGTISLTLLEAPDGDDFSVPGPMGVAPQNCLVIPSYCPVPVR